MCDLDRVVLELGNMEGEEGKGQNFRKVVVLRLNLI
jgi:hypothetical protein